MKLEIDSRGLIAMMAETELDNWFITQFAKGVPYFAIGPGVSVRNSIERRFLYIGSKENMLTKPEKIDTF